MRLTDERTSYREIDQVDDVIEGRGGVEHLPEVWVESRVDRVEIIARLRQIDPSLFCC